MSTQTTRRNMTSEEGFWNWFRKHEPELFALEVSSEAERERIFDQIASELQKVHPHLTFEFGPAGATREFVVSAGGIRSAFPAVIPLTNGAPNLSRWRVIAFRPRRALNIVEFRGKRIDPRDVQFSLLDNGEIAGIFLFIAGFTEDDNDLRQIGYLLLDNALGEHDVETKLGLIKMFSPEANTETERYFLIDLPILFDQLVSKLEQRSGNIT